MIGWEAPLAGFAGGLLTSGSPCVLAAVPVAVGYVGGQARTPMRAWSLSLAFVAGVTLVLVLLGLFAARLGILMGTLSGPWSLAVGTVVIAAGLYMWFAAPAAGWQLPTIWRNRLAGGGVWGAFVLGALISTVLSPCATPALAAALAVAGTGAAFGESMWRPCAAACLCPRARSPAICGRRPAVGHRPVFGPLPPPEGLATGSTVLSALLVLAGLWWVLNGLELASS